MLNVKLHWLSVRGAFGVFLHICACGHTWCNICLTPSYAASVCIRYKRTVGQLAVVFKRILHLIWVWGEHSATEAVPHFFVCLSPWPSICTGFVLFIICAMKACKTQDTLKYPHRSCMWHVWTRFTHSGNTWTISYGVWDGIVWSVCNIARSYADRQYETKLDAFPNIVLFGGAHACRPASFCMVSVIVKRIWVLGTGLI